MIRVLGRLAALVVLSVSMVSSPAYASDELGLSADGQVWTADLAGPLFDPALRWVPGDVRDAEFFVRNQASDGGRLTVAVETSDRDRLLREKDIRLSARVGSDPWVALAPGGQAFRLNDALLPADAVRMVRVKALFDPASGNRSQRKRLALSFRVTLSGEDAATDPDDGVSDETNGPGSAQDPIDAGDLPETGAPSVGWLVLAASGLIGFGMALMRRRNEEEEHRAETSY